jgi:anti-sigma regulatory factor (Ser/Thr protein kinase)
MTQFATTLSRAPESVRIARQFVDTHATGLSAQRLHDAGLLTSELVTNALLHGSGAIGLRIDLEPAAVRIEVSDEGRGAVEMTRQPGRLGGWGLRVVDQLADAWGAEKGSTRVWVRLRRQNSATPSSGVEASA